MDGFFPIFFLMVILKIPVAALLYLVWWAFRQHPARGGAAGAEDHRFRRFRREPKRPRGPRRGGHGPEALPLPDCPPGARTHVLAPRRSPAPHTATSALAPEIDLKALPRVAAEEGPRATLKAPAARQVALGLL